MQKQRTSDPTLSVVAAAARNTGIWLLSLLLAMASLGLAQERFGELNGVATDATGAVLPSANVTLTSTTTGRVTTMKTGTDGTYIFRNVEPGTYRLRVEAAGFSASEVANINIAPAKVLTVNTKLEVSTSTQSVQVTEAAPLIDTTTPLVAQNLSQGEFDRLPKGRSFESLVLTSANTSAGGIEGGIQVNGASASENQFVIDGISTSSVLQGQQRQSAAFEILQEVQIKTGGIEAQYGGATGGVITAITRTGGNDFHGDVHYYFFGSPFNAGPPKRLFMDPNDQVTVSYQQDHKFRDDNHEVGYALGGRIIRNKLFFFSAASPRFRERDSTYISADRQNVTLTADSKYWQAYNKISFTPFNWMSGNVGFLWTPSREDGTLVRYNGYGNQSTSTAASLRANQARGWSAPQNSFTADLTFTLTPKSVFQIRGARFRDNYKALGVAPISAVEWGNSSIGITSFQVPSNLQFGVGANPLTPRVQNTQHDLTTRTMLQADFSQFITNFGGSHDIKIGGGRMKNVNNVDISYPGGGYITLWWDQAYTDPVANERRRGTYGYYQLDDIGTKGSTGGTIDNLYIQDRWRPIRRLSLDLGVRFEKEVVPSFRRDIKEYAFEFGWGQKIAPRLGASYDLLGDGRVKLFGAYGIMYNWIPYELSRGTFGGDVWRTYYRSLDTLDVLSLGNGNLPGRNLFNGAYQDWRIPSFGSEQLDPNIKPMSDTLANAGIEYQIRPNVVVSARYTMNHLREAIEDIGTLDAQGNEVYIYGNPGEGIAKKSLPFNGLTVPWPRPVRKYDGVEFSISRRFAERWFGTASYTWSRLYGNYTGLTSTDEITPPATNTGSTVSQQSGASQTRPGTSSSRYYDLPYLTYTANGQYDTLGRLPTDKPHVLRLYGSYFTKFGAEIGGFFYASSGTPSTTNVFTSQRAPVMVNGRGDMGRTPIYNRTDVMVAYEWKPRWMGEGRALRFEFNAQNLFNQKISLFTYNAYNRYRVATSGMNLSGSKVDFTKAYDWKALVAATADASKSYGALDPRFNKADYFSNGFSGRWGLKFRF